MLLGQFDSLEEIGQEIALYKSEVESRGRAFDPMSVAVARSIVIVDSESEYNQALENRMAGRRRTQALARRPTFEDTREAAQAGTMYGSPDEISADLQALSDLGVEYILLNSPGGIPSLRRFAKDVMPAFAGSPPVAAKSS